VEAVEASGAEALIHLMPKFCEPPMLYYPELRKALDGAGGRDDRNRHDGGAITGREESLALRRALGAHEGIAIPLHDSALVPGSAGCPLGPVPRRRVTTLS